MGTILTDARVGLTRSDSLLLDNELARTAWGSRERPARPLLSAGNEREGAMRVWKLHPVRIGALVESDEKWQSIPSQRVRLSLAPTPGRGVAAQVTIRFGGRTR
jgi:hypothetical protein